MLVPQNIDLKPPKATGNVSIGHEVLSHTAVFLYLLMYVSVPLRRPMLHPHIVLALVVLSEIHTMQHHV